MVITRRSHHQPVQGVDDYECLAVLWRGMNHYPEASVSLPYLFKDIHNGL